MGFGLFKKKASADLVLVNGNVRTMDPDMPLAEAVACASGRIIGVGSRADIESLITAQTQIVDLEGRTVTPGWIEPHSDPIPELFKDQYLPLSDPMTQEAMLGAILAYIERHPEEERYLAYGYGPGTISEEDLPLIRRELDRTSPDKPVVLVASDGLHMILNTWAASAMAREAEELDLPAVTPGLVSSALLSADIGSLLRNYSMHAFALAQRGITGEFVLPSFAHFENIHRELLVDIYQANLLKQRYFGSLLLNTPLPERIVLHHMAQKNTACAELKGLIQFNTLYVRFSGTEGSSRHMSPSYLRQLCTLAADKGYHIRMAALDHPAALTALTLLSELKTSYRRSSFSAEHDEEISEEERSAILTAEVHEYSLAHGGKQAVSSREALENHTVRSADQLGISGDAGTLEVGKWADLAVFEQDPWNEGERPPSAWMTILNGSIVFDRRRDTRENWTRDFMWSAFSEN